MRTLTLTALLVLFVPLTVHAQEYAIDEGSILAGGSASFDSYGGELNETPDGEGYSRLAVNPSVQYFVVPGLAVGGEVLVSRTSWGGASSTMLSIGPAVSYYFGNADSKLFPFVASSLLYTNYEGDASALNVDVSGGASFMLTQSVGLTGEVFYLIDRRSLNDDPTSGYGFGLRAGISAFIF